MPSQIFSPKEKQRIVTDLKLCESIKEEIERAKKAKVDGVEIIEDRHKQALDQLQAIYHQYCGRNQ